jgi:hypothetical protein
VGCWGCVAGARSFPAAYPPAPSRMRLEPSEPADGLAVRPRTIRSAGAQGMRGAGTGRTRGSGVGAHPLVARTGVRYNVACERGGALENHAHDGAAPPRPCAVRL